LKEEIKIKTKDLDLFYGSLQALKSVTMDIPAYRVTALIGPSGCGKSTFLRTLNRMNDLIPDVTVNGKVWVDGIDIYNPDVNVPLLRRKIGMVFQKPNPFPMTIYDNVAYGPRIHGIRKKAILDGIVMRSLTDAALWPEVKDRLGDQAQKLSGGQQQRLCIARALAVEPDILLLDESTSALDPASTQKIEDLISELKTNYTIVMVTHNMQQAARVSDWTAFFMMGEVIEYDQTGNLFYKPQHKETERYLTGRFG